MVGVYVPKLRKIFSFGGSTPIPAPMLVKFGVEESTSSTLPRQISPPLVQRVAPAG